MEPEVNRRVVLNWGIALLVTGLAGCNSSSTTSTTTPTPDASGNGDRFQGVQPASSFPMLQQGGTVTIDGEQESYSSDWVVINPAKLSDTTRIEGVTSVQLRGESWTSFLLGSSPALQTHYRMQADGKPNAYIVPIRRDDGRVRYHIYIDEDTREALPAPLVLANDSGQVVSLGNFQYEESFDGVYKNTVLGPRETGGRQLWVGNYDAIPSDPRDLRAEGVTKFWIEG